MPKQNRYKSIVSPVFFSLICFRHSQRLITVFEIKPHIPYEYSISAHSIVDPCQFVSNYYVISKIIGAEQSTKMRSEPRRMNRYTCNNNALEIPMVKIDGSLLL